MQTRHSTLPHSCFAQERLSWGGCGYSFRDPAPPFHPTAVHRLPSPFPTPRHHRQPPAPSHPDIRDQRNPLPCKLRVMLWPGVDPGRAGASLQCFGRAVCLNVARSRKCCSKTLAATEWAHYEICGAVKHVAHREFSLYGHVLLDDDPEYAVVTSCRVVSAEQTNLTSCVPAAFRYVKSLAAFHTVPLWPMHCTLPAVASPWHHYSPAQ